MKVLYRLILATVLLINAGQCYSSNSINALVLPDLFGCHQLGGEFGLNDNSTLGALVRINCSSDRPTYGTKDGDVENRFSRILVPWRYSFNGVFADGYFLQGLVGLENSEFKTTLGSTAEVTFTNLAVHAGYQWFWRNGFNIALMGGIAYLHENSSRTNIVTGEENRVVDFIDKNTKTNIHGGAGVIVGWLF